MGKALSLFLLTVLFLSMEFGLWARGNAADSAAPPASSSRKTPRTSTTLKNSAKPEAVSHDDSIASATLARKELYSRISAVELRKDLAEIFADPAFENAWWGAAVQSVDTSETLFTLNADKGFMPASNMKLFTTAAALDRLGSDFRYETGLYSTDGDLTDGTVDGDLVAVGSGDPTFSARFHANNSLAPLQTWARELAKRGVRRVTGDIIGHDDVFDDRALAEGWSQSYLTSWYAAEVNGLCLNDNCQDIFVYPGKNVGDPIGWRVVPEGLFGEVILSATTTKARSPSALTFHRRAGSNTVEIRGNLALGSPLYKEWVTVHNPTLFFGFHLKRALESEGIRVEGSPRDFDDLDKGAVDLTSLTLLARYESHPLSHIIKFTNKKSLNLYADQILKTLGARRGRGGSFERGRAVVTDFLKKQGIDAAGFFMDDGSGLSRLNLVRPRQTLGLLVAMVRHPEFPAFLESLPIAGVDGAIERRLRAPPARGNVRAKTGSINRVAALSGYVTTLDGETLAFCFMGNHFTHGNGAAKKLIDRAAERLASFTRHERPERN